jgi:hypothetical protein
MKRLLFLTFLSLTVLLTAAERPYDFRASDAYKRLSTGDRQRLEQVHRDLVLLWGALDMYADGHGGCQPRTLDELVPRYLAKLPSDPFATPQTAKDNDIGAYTPSKGGLGYRYISGAPVKIAGHGDKRGWSIASVGLPDFPYLAENGNHGLYVCKGTWL